MDIINIHPFDWSAIPIKHSNWSLYRLDVEGDKACVHDFMTLTAYEKTFVNADPTTLDNYNPEHEQVVHQICTKCQRVEVVVENIVVEKYENVDNWKDAKMQLALTKSISLI